MFITILLAVLLLFVLPVIIGIKLEINNRKALDAYNYKNLPLEEKKNIEEMHIILRGLNSKLNSNDVTLSYKVIQKLLNNLMKNEKVIYYTMTNINTNEYIYITNKRVIILGDTRVKFIMIEKINSIKRENSTKFEITDNSETMEICCKYEDDIDKFIKTTLEEMDNYKTVSININQQTEKDVLDKIARLKALYDEGILTEFEFNMKKKELLDKK